MATITEFRASFVLIEAFDDMLANPDQAALGFLARASTYAKEVELLLKASPGRPTSGLAVSNGLTLPWSPEKGKNFWTLYLGPQATAMTGSKAWSSVLPLRSANGVSIKAPWLNGRVFAESYLYPHAVALIFTAICQGPFTLDQMMQMAMCVRRDGQFHVNWDAQHQEDLKLDPLMNKVLLRSRQQALGAVVPQSPIRPAKPFSVVTVVSGNGVAPGTVVADGDEVHRMLEALTSWSAAYATQTLPKLAEHSLPTDNSAPENVLYANSRGRCVWIPRCFLPRGATTTTAMPAREMGCYHRNLTLASSQLESLASLCQTQPKGGAQSELRKRAAEILGRLYGGITSTYRSASVRRQIDDNQWVGPINQARADAGLKPLV